MPYLPSQFFDHFPDDDACLGALMSGAMAGRDRMTCQRCGKAARFYRVTGRRAYACQFCGHHFHPCVGTVFEDTRCSLLTWFYAIYLFASARGRIGAKELERQLGVSYRTALRIKHVLRDLVGDDDDGRPDAEPRKDVASHTGPRRERMLRMLFPKIVKGAGTRIVTSHAIANDNAADPTGSGETSGPS
jgi:transposase